MFESPFSYWDNAAHAGVFGSMEFLLSLFCASLLWRRFRHSAVRALTLCFVAMEAASSGIWWFVF